MDDSLQDPPLPSFASIEEECAYWKGRCSEIKQKLIETKQEFADFEDNSRQLEAELETVLEQREKTIQDLKHSLDQLQTDNESLRVCKSNDIVSVLSNQFIFFFFVNQHILFS